jgi:hypothetical protein
LVSFPAELLWLQLVKSINGIKNNVVEKRMFFSFINR